MNRKNSGHCRNVLFERCASHGGKGHENAIQTYHQGKLDCALLYGYSIKDNKLHMNSGTFNGHDMPDQMKSMFKQVFMKTRQGQMATVQTKHKYAAKKIAKNHVKGKAVVIKTRVHVGKIKQLGKANPGHSKKEHFKGKAVAGKHPAWAGVKKGFTELVVHNPKRIKVKTIKKVKKA